jgi:uncharacterized protein YlxW (UPF0749 family)
VSIAVDGKIVSTGSLVERLLLQRFTSLKGDVENTQKRIRDYEDSIVSLQACIAQWQSEMKELWAALEREAGGADVPPR